jgi:hypothetical protein
MSVSHCPKSQNNIHDPHRRKHHHSNLYIFSFIFNIDIMNDQQIGKAVTIAIIGVFASAIIFFWVGRYSTLIFPLQQTETFNPILNGGEIK